MREISCEQLLLSSLIVASGATKLVVFAFAVCGVEEHVLADEAVELEDSDELREQEDIKEQAWLMLDASVGGLLLLLGVFGMPFIGLPI